MANAQYKQQARLSLLLLLSEMPNFIVVFSLAVSTGSLVVFMDLIDSTGNLLRALFMFILAKKLTKNLSYYYNYGVGKLEALSSICLDIVMLLSIASMVGLAVRDIIFPRIESASIGFAVLFKVFCVAGDTYMYVKQRQICKKTQSLVIKAELTMRIKNLVFDASTFLAVLLIFLFRRSRFIMYFSPTVCILLGIWLTVGIIQRMRKATREILDKTANEETHNIILRALHRNKELYETFHGVYSRISGGVIFIDLRLGFSDSTTFLQIQELIDRVYEIVKEDIPHCRISVQITNSGALYGETQNENFSYEKPKSIKEKVFSLIK